MGMRITRRVLAPAAAAFTIALLTTSCAPLVPGELIVTGPGTAAFLVSRPHQREAQGGGYVTVVVGVLPGPLPTLNMPEGPGTAVAWFSNEGQGGKKEKRYGFKPRSAAEYELVLSSDGSGRTKWVINEVTRGSLARQTHSSGHLWLCDPDHPATLRDAGFKDCPTRVEYDSTAIASLGLRELIQFASHIESDEGENLPQNAPIWISCTSGCCSLGR